MGMLDFAYGSNMLMAMIERRVGPCGRVVEADLYLAEPGSEAGVPASSSNLSRNSTATTSST